MNRNGAVAGVIRVAVCAAVGLLIRAPATASDGSLDPSFGVGGLVQQVLNQPVSFNVDASVLQPDAPPKWTGA